MSSPTRRCRPRHRVDVTLPWRMAAMKKQAPCRRWRTPSGSRDAPWRQLRPGPPAVGAPVWHHVRYQEQPTGSRRRVTTGVSSEERRLHGDLSPSAAHRPSSVALALALQPRGARLVGFGRFDKPARREDYSCQSHVDWLRGFLEAVSLRDITLVCHHWAACSGCGWWPSIRSGSRAWWPRIPSSTSRKPLRM